MLVGMHVGAKKKTWVPFLNHYASCYFGNRVSCWSGAHQLDLAGWPLRPKEPPVSTFPVQGFRVNISVPGLSIEPYADQHISPSI